MSEKETQYLKVIGRLYPDNRLRLRPSYLVEDPRIKKEDPKGKIVAKLFDEEKRLLLKYRLSTKHYLTPQEIPELAVRGYIPFPRETALIQFYRDEVLLHEIRVPKEKPILKITWTPPKVAQGLQSISWDATHPDSNLPLQFIVRYSKDNGKSWQRVGWRTEKQSMEINFDELPGGTKCRIAVLVTDGVNTVLTESNTFSVPVKPCIAMILEPEDGSVFNQDEAVIFRGQGYYLEENRAETNELRWTSSIDKDFGEGRLVEIADLSEGKHQITLRAGKGKRVGSTVIEIIVQGRKEKASRRKKSQSDSK